MKNKLSDSRVLNGLFDLILNLPLGDRRTVGIREYEPLGLPRGPFLTPDLALQVLYALKFYIYLFFANVLALVIVARWIRPFGFVVRYCFWIGVCPSGDSRRLTGVWKEESVVARGLKVFLTLVAVVFPIACSPQSQTHPLDTAPIPANARILEEPCSPLGAMMCGAVSILSGETAVERRSACIIYVEPSGRRVEQCGSLPASHP